MTIHTYKVLASVVLAETEINPNHHIQTLVRDAFLQTMRDRTVELASRDQILRQRERGREKKKMFPVQLTASKIGNLNPVDSSSAVIDDYTFMYKYILYIHTYIQGTLSLSKNCTSRESVSPLSRLIRGFRNKYH